MSNVEKELTINGRVYKLVEEEKKHERIEFFVNGIRAGYNDRLSIFKTKDAHADTRMVEIREGETIVSRDDVKKAWQKNSRILESFLKELGL